MPGASPMLLYDASGAPVSSAWAPLSARPGSALASPTGGVVGLGHDYATSPSAGTAYVPKVDGQGSQYSALVTTSGQPVHVTGGQTLSGASAASGPVLMGLAGLVATPVQVDAFGQVLTAPLALPTFVVLASQQAVAAGKSVLALYNGSTAGKVLRLLRVYVQNSSTSAAALTAYQDMAVDVRSISGFSGGTTLTPLAHDSADGLDANVKAAYGSTVSGEITTPYRRWWMSDEGAQPGSSAAEAVVADQQGREPWVAHDIASAKPITLRPGQGAHVKIASSNANQGQVDVTFVFTQANV